MACTEDRQQLYLSTTTGHPVMNCGHTDGPFLPFPPQRPALYACHTQPAPSRPLSLIACAPAAAARHPPPAHSCRDLGSPPASPLPAAPHPPVLGPRPLQPPPPRYHPHPLLPRSYRHHCRCCCSPARRWGQPSCLHAHLLPLLTPLLMPAHPRSWEIRFLAVGAPACMERAT